MGFILMYDISNEESFNATQDWYVLSQRALENILISLTQLTTKHELSRLM